MAFASSTTSVFRLSNRSPAIPKVKASSSPSSPRSPPTVVPSSATSLDTPRPRTAHRVGSRPTRRAGRPRWSPGTPATPGCRRTALRPSDSPSLSVAAMARAAAAGSPPSRSGRPITTTSAPRRDRLRRRGHAGLVAARRAGRPDPGNEEERTGSDRTPHRRDLVRRADNPACAGAHRRVAPGGPRPRLPVRPGRCATGPRRRGW